MLHSYSKTHPLTERIMAAPAPRTQTVLLSNHFYWLPFLLLLGMLFVRLSDYESQCIHPEVYAHIANAIQNGVAFRPYDLLRGFDVWNFDGVERARFLSYVTQILTIKLRLALYPFVPPHPTLQLTWISSLFLAPLFLYKAVKNMTDSKPAAIQTTLLYMCSVGLLSHLSFWFHAAKPLASFFLILSIYFGSLVHKLNEGMDDNSRLSRPFRMAYFGLLVTVFLSLFADETSFITYALIPLLFPTLFIVYPFSWSNKSILRRKVFMGLMYLAVLFLFLGFVTFIVTKITVAMGLRPFPYWQFIMGSGPHEGTGFGGSVFSKFDWRRLFTNARMVFSTSYALPFGNMLLSWAFLFVLGGYILFLFASTRPAEDKIRRTIMKIVIAVLVFMALQTLIQGRHPDRFFDGSYKGSFFSVLMAIFLGASLSLAHGWTQVINRFLVILLMGVQFQNFQNLHEMSVDGAQDPLYNTQRARDQLYNVRVSSTPNLVRIGDGSFKAVYRIWRQWKETGDLTPVQKAPLPVSLYWLKVELEAVSSGRLTK